MNAEIISLKCPSCGNANNVVEHDARFGLEFKCSHCATVSVIVLNHQLYMPAPGEHVCVECGRVALPGARFCQCGASLVRRCINQECLKEFPVDHGICDYCGWPQEVNPATADATEIKLQRVARDLKDPSLAVQNAGWKALIDITSGQQHLLMDWAANHPDDEVRQAALNLIVWVVSTYAQLATVLNYYGCSANQRKACEDGLPLLDFKTRNAVEKYLNGGTEQWRKIARDLMQVGEKQLMSALHGMLSQARNAEEFAMVWVALAQLSEKEAISRLETAAKKVNDPRIIGRAVNGLLERDPQRALRFALQMFENSPEAIMQEASGEILVQIGPVAVPELEKLSKGPFRSNLVKARAKAILDRIQANDTSGYA